MSEAARSTRDGGERSAGGRLRGAYLRTHHARVREASDHPLVHMRRMLADVARARGDGGVLCDVGAGFEGARPGRWTGRRVSIDLAVARGVDVVADGHALPLRDKSAAAVVLMEVLEHVPTPLDLLRECARVLEMGGFLCLTAPQYCILHGHPGDYYRYTNQGLDYLCREAGLSIVDVRATGGPALVLFHAIERNLHPRLRLPFVAAAYRLSDWLDGRVFGHGNRPGVVDAVGWAVRAVKA